MPRSKILLSSSILWSFLPSSLAAVQHSSRRVLVTGIVSAATATTTTTTMRRRRMKMRMNASKWDLKCI
jgi:hypothetical protein